MISGKVALGGLTLEFGDAQKRFEGLRREVEALTRAHTKLLTDEQEIIEALARTYLPELTPETVSAGLGELRKEMHDALEAQETHRRELEQRLAQLPEDIARRELLLAEAERAEEHAADALDGVRRSVERELASDEGHTRDVVEHRAIMERRSILKARRTRLQAVASGERRNYERDPAFAYLMRRRYSEPEYRGRLVTRWLDSWLARRIDFQTLIRNYRILRTGAAATHAEIRRLTERAEQLERVIDAREEEVGSRLGLLAALEAESLAQKAVIDAREVLRSVRSSHDRLAAEIRAVDAHRGRPYEDAVATHRAFLEDRTLSELVCIARSTPDPRDDDLVATLDETRTRLEEVGQKLERLRGALEQQASRTTSLAELARDALARFTSRRSRFPEEFNLQELVQSVVDGRASPKDAFGQIADAHVPRPLLVPTGTQPIHGWFAELSSRFDPELRAVSERVDGSEIDSEVVVYDRHGQVLHRRVTKRNG
jgi:hypothetical protein